MQASKMTNDELAKELVEPIPDGSRLHRSDVLRESAARLRKMDAIIAKLKAADDALKPWPSLAEWLVVNAAKLGISDMVDKLRQRMDESNNALSAIREEGGAK